MLMRDLFTAVGLVFFKVIHNPFPSIKLFSFIVILFFVSLLLFTLANNDLHYSRAIELKPRAGSGVVRIDPLRFLAGCRKRRLKQA